MVVYATVNIVQVSEHRILFLKAIQWQSHYFRYTLHTAYTDNIFKTVRIIVLHRLGLSSNLPPSTNSSEPF